MATTSTQKPSGIPRGLIAACGVTLGDGDGNGDGVTAGEGMSPTNRSPDGENAGDGVMVGSGDGFWVSREMPAAA